MPITDHIDSLSGESTFGETCWSPLGHAFRIWVMLILLSFLSRALSFAKKNKIHLQSWRLCGVQGPISRLREYNYLRSIWAEAVGNESGARVLWRDNGEIEVFGISAINRILGCGGRSSDYFGRSLGGCRNCRACDGWDYQGISRQMDWVFIIELSQNIYHS